MKKTALWMIASVSMLFTGFWFTACSDNEEIPPTPPEAVPTVTLTAGEPTTHSIVFTLMSKDADKCAYRVLPSADNAPDAAAVLSSGTSVPAGESKTVEVGELTPNTSYTIYAAASAGEKVGELKTLQMTTKKEVPQEVTTIELERPQLAYYYTDDEEGTVGNFYFTLIRGEVDDHVGMPLPGPDNFVLGLDLYTAMPSDLEHPVCPDGTYTYSGVPGVRGTFYVNEDGLNGPSVCFTENAGAIAFKDGSFTMTYANGEYTLEGTVTGKEDNATYRFVYTGEIPFVNRDLPQKDEIVCTEADAVWFGDQFQMNTCVWELQMRDVSLLEDGTPAAAGSVIDLTFFGEPCEFETALMTEGEYKFDNTFAVKTLMRGGQDGNGGYVGSRVSKWDGGTYNEILTLYSGTMTLTRHGDNYTIVLDALTDRDVAVTASYEGPIAITRDVPDDPEEPGFSTITQDITLSQEDILYRDLYDFGDYFEGGVRTYNFVLSTADADFNIFLFTEMESVGSVPTGTYTIKAEAPYEPFTAARGIVDGDGTDYKGPEGFGYVKSGTIQVVNNGNNNYELTWDLVDDTPSKHKITGSCAGTFELW